MFYIYEDMTLKLHPSLGILLIVICYPLAASSAPYTITYSTNKINHQGLPPHFLLTIPQIHTPPLPKPYTRLTRCFMHTRAMVQSGQCHGTHWGIY
jgi:hypothetical protein